VAIPTRATHVYQRQPHALTNRSRIGKTTRLLATPKNAHVSIPAPGEGLVARVTKTREARGETKTIAPRIDHQTIEWYAQNFESATAGATLILESWPTIYTATLSELRGVFSEPELKLMLDVCNGLALTGRLVGSHLLLEVADGCVLNGADTKWAVDREVLVGKLRPLLRAQCAALECWAAAFWAGEYNDTEFEQAHLALLCAD